MESLLQQPETGQTTNRNRIEGKVIRKKIRLDDENGSKSSLSYSLSVQLLWFYGNYASSLSLRIPPIDPLIQPDLLFNTHLSAQAPFLVSAFAPAGMTSVVTAQLAEMAIGTGMLFIENFWVAARFKHTLQPGKRSETLDII